MKAASVSHLSARVWFAASAYGASEHAEGTQQTGLLVRPCPRVAHQVITPAAAASSC